MSASAEVDNASGEGSERVDVIELLAEKVAGREATRARFAVAKTMYDEQGQADESRLLDAYNVTIPELERKVAVVLEARGKKEAEERLLGIKRAAGSHRNELKKCDALVREAEKELLRVNAQRTAWARTYEADQAELNALSDRFDLPPVRLEVVDEPPRIEVPTPWQYKVVKPGIEQCEHNLRQRRDYTEIAGSIGYAIIETAGLRPFRALTQQEKAVLEDKADERKPDPVLAAAAAEAHALGALRVPLGGVYRG